MKLTSIADLATKEIHAVITDTAYKLSDRFDDYLANYREDGNDDGAHRSPGIHASELCQCKRQVVYTMYSTEKRSTTSPTMQKRFNMGNAVHHMLQRDFHRMARRSKGRLTFQDELKTHETELGRQLDLTSSCDGVFTFWDENRQPIVRVGLEIKSAAPDDWAKMKAPNPKHIEQAHLYMRCFDLPLMWFLYWNKGNQNYTKMEAPWLMKFDQRIWDKQETRARDCLTSADAEELPEREEGYHCSWCPYAYLCEPKTQPTGSRPHFSAKAPFGATALTQLGRKPK